MLIEATIGAVVVGVALWQDRLSRSYDGDRYTSCVAQPQPFNRRFHHWPAKVLAVTTMLSALFVTATLGSWQAAAMFATLPGVVFCVTHATTVDLPAMALAWACSLLWCAHPLAAIALSLASGVIHERGPVFAAVYAFSPWPLIGLAAVQWWAKPAQRVVRNDSDRYVGHSFVTSLNAHRGARDLLGPEGLIWALRGVPVVAAWLSTSVAGWTAFALSAGSRLVSTDAGRSMLWAAPPMLAAIPEIPPWFVALHVMSMKRMV